MGEQTIHILLVEDEAAHVELICRAFRAYAGRFQLTVASSLAEARSSLAAPSGGGRPDLIITDLLLPDGQGIELLPPEAESMPFPLILMTSYGNEKVAVEAMKAGASDYIVKSATSLADMPRVAERARREWEHIFERKRAEEALRNSEARYRLLAENATDIIWTVDLNLNCTYISPSVQYMLGYSVEEAIAESSATFLPPALVEVARNMLRDELASTQTSRGSLPRARTLEVESISRDGSQLWTEVKLSFIRGPAGQPVGLLGVTRDISERKHLEAQLRQAQKMEAIGRLAGGIAHDFNNLLTAMLGYTDLVLADLDAGSQLYQDIMEIQTAGERAAALTHQLLAFSRQQVLQPKLQNLNSVVAKLSHMLHRLIGEDIELVTILGTDLGWVKADPSQLEQVIINLAVNARDAMPEGGKLTMETANVILDEEYTRRHVGGNPGPYVMLAISDTGHGMDVETRSRIFEPFFTTKEQGKGTGLGLAMVHGIVHQSGGLIWVYSEPGRGSSFKIYLPRVNQDSPTAMPLQAVATSPPGSEIILLVEDNAEVRGLASRILIKHNYTVLEASNGVEALQVAQTYANPIDLVITDVIMPGGLSGPQLIQQLGAHRPKMKVLYMSGYTDNAIVHHGVLAPGLAFLQKPFTPNSLVQKVREVLDAASGTGADTGAHTAHRAP